ncbi:hypothetical protein CIG75_10280 [Tumebacillus algifaecis]|uniref:Glycosyl transferase family 1 n=1 Tax=Tumebacillus algifaecis TaxID=1214604 RepID=A0A223D0Q1_9BACL|nr:glycosyltransferase family 4 protein [Tumebacillus algifaecis]ASS75339.1 hypothetical protein CIG75_10280 [Tumebacillus algifaecis]
MRLLVMSNEFRPFIIGGLGIVATELTNALAQDKTCQITVLTKGPKRYGQVRSLDNLKVVRLPQQSSYTSRTHFFPEPLEQWLLQQPDDPPELLHVHSVQCLELALRCRARWNIPLVYTCHSLVLHEKANAERELVVARQERLLVEADSITVPSLWLQEEIEHKYPRCQGKITIIPNGVTLHNAASRPINHPLLFVGRLIPVKGIEELLHAIALLRAEDPHVKLSVIGTGTERYTKHLHKLCEDLGLSDSVRWLGHRSHQEVHRAYTAAGAVLVPSRSESFGLTALEALAAGAPLVATQSGGLSHYIDEKVASVLSDISPQTIAAGIRSMWQDPERTARRTAEGLKLAARFSWAEIAFRYGALFQALIAERGGKNAKTPLETRTALERETPRTSLGGA